MRKIKRIGKRLIIIYVILYIFLGSFGSCFASQSYNAACGEYLADFAREFIAKYGSGSVYGGRTGKDSGSLTTEATEYPGWTDGTLDNPGGTLYCCCTSGVWYMYYLALGIDIYSLGYSANSDNDMYLATNYSEYWEEVSLSDTLPGDILVRNGHVEMVITAGNAAHANFGGTSSDAAIIHDPAPAYSSDTFEKAFRLKSTVKVDPSGTVSGYGISSSSVTLSNFYFNGIPDGEYSIASTNIFDTIIEAFSTVADYLIGIMVYGIRIVIVGWTALFDQIITNFVNELTGGSVTSDGVSSVEIQSASNSERVTIENLVYNLYAPLDINIFKEN